MMVMFFQVAKTKTNTEHSTRLDAYMMISVTWQSEVRYATSDSMNSQRAIAPRTLPRTTKLDRRHFLPMSTTAAEIKHSPRLRPHRRGNLLGRGERTYVTLLHVFHMDRVRKKANRFVPTLYTKRTESSFCWSMSFTDGLSSRSLSDVAVSSDSEVPDISRPWQ